MDFPAAPNVSVASSGWFRKSMVESAFRFITAGASTVFASVFRGHASSDKNQEVTNHVSSGPLLEPSVRINEKPDQGENLDEVDRLLNLKRTINRDEYDQITQIVRSKLADNKDRSQPLRQRHENMSNDFIFSMVPQDPAWYIAKSCFRKISPLGYSGSLRKVQPKPTLIAPSWEGPGTAASYYIVPPQSSAMASKASQDPVKLAKPCIGLKPSKVLPTKSFCKAQLKPGARKKVQFASKPAYINFATKPSMVSKDAQYPAISHTKQVKPSKASTTNSALGAQSMIGRTNNVQFISEPPYVSFVSEPSNIIPSKYTEKGYPRPMRIGRSEVFRMAGAPCPWNPSVQAQVTSKLLKRKNSPDADDTGYSDSLRIVRQKPTLIFPSNHDSSAPAGYYLVPSQPIDQDSRKKLERHESGKNDHNAFYNSVPPQSTAVAKKILASLIDPLEGWSQTT